MDGLAERASTGVALWQSGSGWDRAKASGGSARVLAVTGLSALSSRRRA